ncbi:hypothetical protein PV11_00044 [Exophiala sideris]|uniref:Major facilitator superfamily (MFS) profile domain-containing protein n=1 Tax=Exophiala sideris TaxID=1016849 RepID=A0A0D1YS38_9EURO|nr:hypothetical protein PV11_00044 [Exophiala sideris]
MTDIANPYGSPFSASTPLDLGLNSESEHPMSKHLSTQPDQPPLSSPRAMQNPRQQPRKDGCISLGREETQFQKALQVIGSCFLYMNSWGILNSFGAFQAYYAQTLRPSKSESQIAWIGSLQGFLLLFIGVLVGPAIDVGYMRHVLTVGSLLFAFGLFMTSLCHQYYQLILAQGLVVGIGAGCIFLPSITVVPQWFSPQRSPLALGIVATGSSIGGIIFPAMFHSIQISADFGWAVRVIAFVALATNVFGTAVLKYQAPLPEHHRALLDMSMLKERYFLPLCAALWLALAGLYIPIFFIPSYYLSLSPSTSQGSSSATLAFWLVPTLWRVLCQAVWSPTCLRLLSLATSTWSSS